MALGDAVARLLRPDRSPVLRLLQDAPLTPADILAVPGPPADPEPAPAPDPAPRSDQHPQAADGRSA